jgi:hypothetical protein
MPGDPHSGGKVCEAPHREIDKPGENREEVIAHRDLQPTAAFHDRENRRNFRCRLWAANVQPILSTRATGRMEFSASERVLAGLAKSQVNETLPSIATPALAGYQTSTPIPNGEILR